MATNNEIAVFEGFKFQIGDMVRPIADRVALDMLIKQANESQSHIEGITPMVGMVTMRWLFQDEAGISHAYSINGPFVCDRMLKEFELEGVEQ